MAVLPTNYLDDILAASMGGKRRFRITHEDGSTEEVTLEDVSEYEQVGSPFGSGDVNKTNQAVNEKLDSADVVDPALATVLGFAADAKLTGDALSELNKKISAYTDISSEINSGTSRITLNSAYGYICNNHVHIEAQITTNENIESTVPLLALPKKYCPSNAKCGSAVIAGSDMTIKTMCFARVLMNINGNYAVVTQSQTSSIASGSIIGLIIDYII